MIRHLRVTVNGKSYDVTVEDLGQGAVASPSAGAPPTASVGSPSAPAAPVGSPSAPTAAPVAAPAAGRAAAGGPDDLLAPLGGIIVAVSVAVGDTVALDQPVATLEAMKMQTVISAHKAGRVTAVYVNVGEGVDADQPLLAIS
jgi:biotin carboxyl carrier protein